MRQEERDLLAWAGMRGLRSVVVLTKADKVNRSLRLAAARQARQDLGLEREPLVFSVRDREAVARLRQVLVELASPA